MGRWDITANQKMKRFYVFVVTLFTFISTMNAATISLAVMDFKPGSSKADNLEGLSDMLINSLYDSGNYEIVERGQINYALKELGLQGKSLSVADLTKMGEYLKVSHVLVGTVNFIATGNSSEVGFLEGEYNIDVRIVDVKTSRIVATAGVTKNSSQTYRSLMPDLASQLSRKINTTTVPCLQGYLYVYPEKLGTSTLSGAKDKIKHLNACNSFGRNNWRLPTTDELKMIAQNLSVLNYEIEGEYGYAFSSGVTYKGVQHYYIYDLKRRYLTSYSYEDLGSRWVILVSTQE